MATNATGSAPPSAEYLMEDRGNVLIGISIAFITLTTIVLILRYWARLMQQGSIMLADDILLYLAYVVNLGMCALGIIMVHVGGVGRHIEYVEAERPDQVAGWAKCLLAFEIVYFTSVCLPKLSIICLYQRVFSWQGRTRHLVKVLLVVTALTSVSLVVTACFQCVPIAFWWDPTIPGGRCVDIQAFFHGQAIPGLILDLAIIALPIRTILGLQLTLAKRLAVCFIFTIGSFGIVASIIRATKFFSTPAFSDRTWASVDLVGWSIVETSVYIITGCLPHFRPLVIRFGGKWLKTMVSGNAKSNNSGYAQRSVHAFSSTPNESLHKSADHSDIPLETRDQTWSRLSSEGGDIQNLRDHAA